MRFAPSEENPGLALLNHLAFPGAVGDPILARLPSVILVQEIAPGNLTGIFGLVAGLPDCVRQRPP